MIDGFVDVWICASYQRACAAWWHMTQSCRKAHAAFQRQTVHTAAEPPCCHTAFLGIARVDEAVRCVPSAASLHASVCRDCIPTACSAVLSSKGLIVPEESSSNFMKVDWEIELHPSEEKENRAQLLIIINYHNYHKHAVSCTCRWRRLDSRVPVCLRLRLERPLVCLQSKGR